MTRIQDKIGEIEKYLDELDEIIPDSIEEYKSSLVMKAACERYVEKIVEAATDLAFITIKSKRLRLPDDDADAFTVLLENKIIDEEIAKKLRNAKGMKNIVAHQYGKVDDEIIFESVSEELGEDMLAFVEVVRKVK